MIALGGELRALREKSGISLREMADQLFISPPYLSDLERGNRDWSSILIAKFKVLAKPNGKP
jgi:transcriptional regulator with XRE-family HTH domain